MSDFERPPASSGSPTDSGESHTGNPFTLLLWIGIPLALVILMEVFRTG